MDTIKSQRLICLILFLFAFVLYGNTIGNEYALDDEMVTNNDQVKGGIRAIPEIFTTNYRITDEYNYGYRPITKSTFALEYQLFGENPHISHLINVLIYALTGIFLFLLLVNMFKGYHPLFSMVITLIFLAHPVHTEVVASLKNREELISFICSLAALALLFKSVGKFRPIYIVGGVLFFVIGFFAKQNAATFLMVIPLSMYFFTDFSLPSIQKPSLAIKELVPVINVSLIRYIVPMAGLAFFIAGMVVNVYFILVTLLFTLFDVWKFQRTDSEQSSTELKYKRAILIGACYGVVIFNDSYLDIEVIKPLYFLLAVPYFLYLRDLVIELSHRSSSASQSSLRSNLILLIGVLFIVMAELFRDRSFLLFALAFLIMDVYVVIRLAGAHWRKIFVNGYVITGLMAVLLSEYFYKYLGIKPGEMNEGWMLVTYLLMLVYAVYIIDKNSLLKKYFNKARGLYHRLIGIKISKTTVLVLGVLALLGVVTYLLMVVPTALLPPEHREIFYFENPLTTETGWSSLFGTGFYTLLVYMKLLLVPHPLLFYYGFDHISVVNITNEWVVLSLIIHVLLLVYAIVNLKRKHILSYAILYYFVTIMVFSNIMFKIPGIVGERLLYMPSLGFCIALAYFIFKLLKIDPKLGSITSGLKLKLGIVLTLLIIPYSVKTITRNNHWENHLTLYMHDIPNLEKSLYANSLAASELLRNIKRNPITSEEVSKNQKKLNAVIKHLNQVLKLDANDKHALNNLGTVYYSFYQDYVRAIPYFQKAVLADSTFGIAYFNMAYCFEQTGNSNVAINFYKRTLELQPLDVIAISNLANLCEKLGDLPEALRLNGSIIKINPKTEVPYMNMGNYYLNRADESTAVKYFEKAALLDPENQKLFIDLGDYFKENGDLKKARYYYDKANNVKQLNFSE